MDTTFKRIVITAIAFIVIAGAAAAFVVAGGCSTDAGSFDSVRNGAVNTLIDASGIKDRVEQKVRSEAAAIAEATGLPQSVIDHAVDSLAIQDWQAATLPEDEVETGTYAVEFEGTSAEITLYEDPSFVTIDAYGQSVTMQVPKSAQTYIPFLKYLDYLEG